MRLRLSHPCGLKIPSVEKPLLVLRSEVGQFQRILFADLRDQWTKQRRNNEPSRFFRGLFRS